MRALKAREPPREDRQRLIFKLSEDEIKAGILQGWFSEEQMDGKYGKGKWRALPRHVIQQGSKWRLIDDGRAGEHNLTYGSDETIHTTSSSAGIALAAHFRAVNGRKLSGPYSLQVATQDMWKAYRQVPCHHDQCRYMAVMVWHPTEKKWMYGEAKGLLFGLTGAVLAFNRVPTFIVAVVLLQNFFDDFRIFDIAVSKGSANKFLK